MGLSGGSEGVGMVSGGLEGVDVEVGTGVGIGVEVGASVGVETGSDFRLTIGLARQAGRIVPSLSSPPTPIA